MAFSETAKEDKLFNDRPDFNMAVLFLTRLDARNEDCDQAFMEGNMLKAYRGLRNIYLMVKFKVKTNATKVLLFKQYEDYLTVIDKCFLKVSALMSNQKMASMNLTQTEKELDNIRELIYDLLWDLHFIFPQKFKVTFQDEIKGDFT